jgi:hypothetical protein
MVIKLILVCVPACVESRARAWAHSPRAPGVCRNYRENKFWNLCNPAAWAHGAILVQEMHTYTGKLHLHTRGTSAGDRTHGHRARAWFLSPFLI